MSHKSKDNNKFFDFHPNIKEVISENIRIIRKEKGYTQQELALMVDISYDFMRRIETGKGKVGFSIQTLYKIAVALETSVDKLMGLK